MEVKYRLINRLKPVSQLTAKKKKSSAYRHGIHASPFCKDRTFGLRWKGRS